MSVTYGQKLHVTSADRKNKRPFCAGPVGGRPQRAAATPHTRSRAGQSTARFWRTLSHGRTHTW